MKLNMYKAQALHPGFENKVTGVAKVFERYLDQYYNMKALN